jgi:hypothetical protein
VSILNDALQTVIRDLVSEKCIGKQLFIILYGVPIIKGNASLRQSPRLLDQACGKTRLKHYSIRMQTQSFCESSV